MKRLIDNGEGVQPVEAHGVVAVRAGHVRIEIDRTMPLEEAAQAQRLLEERQTSGSVVLLP